MMSLSSLVLTMVVVPPLLIVTTASAIDNMRVAGAEPGHVTCTTDEDCDRNEVCMSWQYDPALEFARKLSNRLSSGGEEPEKHQFCIDSWIIYNTHLAELDEPRTGGGLRSSRRGFDSDDYYFSARRPARQYSAYGEDMMLVLFLVCILATLVTVHRAACYRQIQDARRNTPLRHILPIPEDRPPPYINRYPDSVDGPSSIVHSSSGPKPLTEAPPPTYEEALARLGTAQHAIEPTQADQLSSSTDLEARDEAYENAQIVTNVVSNQNPPVASSGAAEDTNPDMQHTVNTTSEVSPVEDPDIHLEEDNKEVEEVIASKEVDTESVVYLSSIEEPIHQSHEENTCVVNIENEILPSIDETEMLIVKDTGNDSQAGAISQGGVNA